MSDKHQRRRLRLHKIRMAQNSIEESLLNYRKVGNPTLEEDKAFGSLWYLIRLAKKAGK